MAPSVLQHPGPTARHERTDRGRIHAERRPGLDLGPPARDHHARRQPARSLPEAAITDSDHLRIPVGLGALHVERFGHGGQPVILLHGFPTSTFLWRHVGPDLAARDYTAFAIDLLGYGESDRPYDAAYTIEAQAEYVDRAMTALRLASATVVGIDLGGAVALRLAATRPERVDQLILINPLALDEVPGGDIKALQRSTARHAVRMTRGILGVAPLLTPLLEGSVAEPDRMPTKLVARYLAPFVGKEGIAHLLMLARSVRADDLEELELRDVRVPTLIVWGDQDQWLDNRLPERLANAIPTSTLVRIPSVARLVPEEAPERLIHVMLEFVRREAMH